MATRIVGKNTRIYVDRFIAYLRSYDASFDVNVNAVESSVYFEDWKTFEIIDGEGPFTFSARYETDGFAAEQDPTISLQAGLEAALFIPPLVISWMPDARTPVAGHPTWFGDYVTGRMAMSLPRNGLGDLKIDAKNNGQLFKGYMLALADISLSAGVDQFFPTLGFNVVAGSRGIAAVYHLWKKTGAGTLQCAIQGATSSGGSFTDRLTFPMTANADVVQNLDQNTTELFHRARIRSTATETVSMLVASRRY
jgi:hypothetical protein